MCRWVISSRTELLCPRHPDDRINCTGGLGSEDLESSVTMKDQNSVIPAGKAKGKPRARNSAPKKSPAIDGPEGVHFFCNSCDEHFTQKHLLVRHVKLHEATASQRKPREAEDSHLSRGRGKSCPCERCGPDCGCESAPGKRLVPAEGSAGASCRVCKKQFKHERLLHRHMEQHAGEGGEGRKPLECRTCGKLYTKIGSLTNHELQHEGKGTFRCRPCGASFTTEEERTRHKSDNHAKPWKCSLCHHSFTAESRLEAHAEWHASKVAEAFLCSLCGKEFKLKVNLKVHVESRCGTEPQHACGVCGKAFMTRGTLATHSLLHTGEKTFLCRFCGKSFRLKVEMQRHERSHTGEKPFVCKVCGKAFAYRESLVTHNTLHTGRRPYMCECCASTFSCIGNLIKHRTIYAGKCGESNCNTRDKSKRAARTRKSVPPPPAADPAPSVDIHSSVVGTLIPIKPVETALVVTSTIIPIVTAPVITMNGTAASELQTFVQANCYGYRNPCYESNTEWITPLFATHDSAAPMSMDLHPGNMDKGFKSSHYYWGNNNGAVMQPDPCQHTFPSYGTVIRDPLKPDSSFQELTVYGAQQGLAEMNTMYQPTGTEGHITENFNAVFIAPGYAAGDAPREMLLPTDPLACNRDGASSSLLTSNAVGSPARADGLETPAVVCSPVEDSKSGMKAEEPCCGGSPTSNGLSDCELLAPKPEPGMDILNDGTHLLSVEASSSILQDKEPKCEDGCENGNKAELSSEKDYSVCTIGADIRNKIRIDNETVDVSGVKSENIVDGQVMDTTRLESDSDEEESLEKRLERRTRRNGKLNSDKRNKFYCQDCKKGFDFLSRLMRHRKCHASDLKEALACRFCDRKYTNKSCLAKHEAQHSEDFFCTCKECGQRFGSKVEYRSHRARMHRRLWNCTVCERAFSTASNLKNHASNKHHGEAAAAPSYVCHICGKLFKQKGNLKVHMDSRCGTDPQFVCNVCGKAFMSYGSLGTHLLLHTGEKTFLCRFCGKSFRLKVEMQRHERTHTGEKPFVCKVCGKAFAHRESLVTHNTTHTGVRPYMCEVCGSTFSCIGNLIKHRQTRNRRCGLARAGMDGQRPPELSAAPQNSFLG